MKIRKQLALVTFTALAAMSAQAQNIERMKMTDGDLTCQQMFDEIKMMDMVAAQASAQPQQAAAPADNGVGSQVAGAVAQQAVAQVAARSGFGGLFGGGSTGGMLGGNSGGGLGGLFGGLAQQAVQQAAAPAPAPAPTGNPMLAQQAAGRKEHLTGLFLGKGCKMSDVR